MIVLGALEVSRLGLSLLKRIRRNDDCGDTAGSAGKGGDYKPGKRSRAAKVWANGGEVMVLNFEDGCSTTNIIKRSGRERSKTACNAGVTQTLRALILKGASDILFRHMPR